MERLVDHLITWSELVLALGGAVMAIGYGLRRVYLMARNVEELVGIARKGVETSVANAARLADIEKELKPNGGSSMRDAVNGIHAAVHALDARLDVLEDWRKSTKRHHG